MKRYGRTLALLFILMLAPFPTLSKEKLHVAVAGSHGHQGRSGV